MSQEMVTNDTSARGRKDLELRILDAARVCVERCGFDEVTVDEVCEAAGVSRATLYRVFPGGRDVLFEALRVRGLEEFFTVVRANVEGAQSLDVLLTRCVVVSMSELQHDEQLAAMLATSPGEALGNLTVDGVGRIVRVATEFFVPLVKQFVPDEEAHIIVELMVRLVISYFLAPSPTIDCTDEQQVHAFICTYLPQATRATHFSITTSQQ